MADERETKKSKAVKIEPTAEGVAQMSFADFYGYAMQKTMGDKRMVNDVIKELQMWYHAQPLEGRAQLARDISTDLEKGMSIAHSLFVSFRQIAMGDLINPPQTL